jgi:hypothetical protein
VVSGEADKMPMDVLGSWRVGEIMNFLAEYALDDIFNADETGLFYQLMQNRTLALPGTHSRAENNRSSD